MYLKTLALKNFRNIKDQKIVFHPEFNFIFGKNAQGKTNLIEAIFYLAELKSFRTSNRTDIIQSGESFCQVYAVFEKDELFWDIQITMTPEDRRVLLNQKKPQSRHEYYGLIPLILFEPRHIYLFRESPSERRRYLNRALYIQDVNALALFRDYDKVLAQKNRLLKDGTNSELLDVWNERLSVLAAEIILKRQEWLRGMNALMTSEYQAISNSKEEVVLVYHSSIEGLDLTGLSKSHLISSIKDRLDSVRNAEMQRRESLVGPHRDDFKALVGGRVLGVVGSQGENRSMVIALKMSQLKMFEKKHQKTPLFLLDDVASELDEERCRYLFDYLKKEKTQVFLTTTDNTLQAKDFIGHATSFFIENGKL